jgi:hypothetical protein
LTVEQTIVLPLRLGNQRSAPAFLADQVLVGTVAVGQP